MVTAYILILCLSSALAAWSATRVAQRLTRLLALPVAPQLGVVAAVSAITFLIVVGMPAMLLTGAVALLLLGLLAQSRYLPSAAPVGLPLIAIALGVGTLTLPTIHSIPPLALVGAIATSWFAFLYSARFLPTAPRPASLSILAALLPLIVAPLLFTAPNYVALDAAIIASALAGILLARGHSGLFGGSNAVFAHLLFWLIAQAVLQDAWPCALLSLLAWLGAIAYASSRSPTPPVPHAPTV